MGPLRSKVTSLELRLSEFAHNTAGPNRFAAISRTAWHLFGGLLGFWHTGWVLLGFKVISYGAGILIILEW